MFSRILFPTDFSSYANAVLDCLPELRSVGMSEVILLSVIRGHDVPLPETFNRDALDYWRWSFEEQLNVARMALEGKKLRVKIRVEYGSPVQCIVRVAAEEQVSMIVMGAQGATAAQELLIGSTAFEVLRHASVPVLLEKFEMVRGLGHVQCRRLCANMFKHVLHPTDFSTSADYAFQVVKRLKFAGTQNITLLHVQDERELRRLSTEQRTEYENHAKEQLNKLGRALMLSDLQPHIMLRHGIPFRETLKVADEIGQDCLIVIGTKGLSAVSELLSGSTFENVIRLSSHPVLVIRSAKS